MGQFVECRAVPKWPRGTRHELNRMSSVLHIIDSRPRRVVSIAEGLRLAEFR
jgi:hypothetical protein